MGEISRALDELRTKCTTEGTLPTGNSVADILEYIAENYDGGGSGSELPDIALERIANYLYKVSFNTLPEAPEDLELNIGACSSYVLNGKLYRNLDWKYSETAEFVVTTKKFKGMAYIDGLNDSNLDREKINKLPYRIVDGVNESGIMVSTNVLYNDWEYAGSGEKNINILQIPFLILNNITTLTDFDDQMSEYLSNIKIPNSLAEMDYLLHFLVSDGSTTYVIEPPESQDGNYTVIDATNNPKLTNFRWVDRAEVDRTDEDMQTRPTGIERFNAMPCDMASIKFTNAYESPDWLSEFIGEADTTKDSTDEELLEVYNTAREIYLERERNGETWQTMHSVTYSPNGMEKLFVQENFDVDLIGGGGDSGLPDPSDLPDGTALVSVNGEWALQDGYGYTEGGRVNLLTQDEADVEFNIVNQSVIGATIPLREEVFTNLASAFMGTLPPPYNRITAVVSGAIYNLVPHVISIIPDEEMCIYATSDFETILGGGFSFSATMFLITETNQAALMSADLSFEGTHTISIYEESETVTPIDGKFTQRMLVKFAPENSEGSLTLSCDHTFAEVKEAIQNGVDVRGEVIANAEQDFKMNLTLESSILNLDDGEESDEFITFTHLRFNDGIYAEWMSVTLGYDDNVYLNEKNPYSIPEFDGDADEGKVLTVHNDGPRWILPDSEPVIFYITNEDYAMDDDNPIFISTDYTHAKNSDIEASYGKVVYLVDLEMDRSYIPLAYISKDNVRGYSIGFTGDGVDTVEERTFIAMGD